MQISITVVFSVLMMSCRYLLMLMMTSSMLCNICPGLKVLYTKASHELGLILRLFAKTVVRFDNHIYSRLASAKPCRTGSGTYAQLNVFAVGHTAVQSSFTSNLLCMGFCTNFSS